MPSTFAAFFDALRAQDKIYVPYYTSLGEFISRFSEIELAMQALLWIISGLPKNVAKRIFAGYKIDQSITAIKKIYEGKNKKLDKELERAFQQIGIINGERNFIVHYGAEMTPEGLTVSNKKVAFKGRESRSFPVSPEILENMRKDLKNIHMILLIYNDRKKMDKKNFQEVISYFSRKPFLYKSPQPTNKDRKNPKNPHKRKPQP